MKYTFLFFFFVLLYSCQSKTNNHTNAGSDSPANSATAQTPTAKKDTYFVLLKGTIGAYPVTMYLYALKQKYSGYYYYDSKQQPIYLLGDDTLNAGKTTLSAYHQDSTEIFVLNFDGINGNGTWTYNGKTLPVKLSEVSMSVKFSYRYWQDSMKLTDTLKSSPQASAELSSIWPEGSSATDEFIKTQIAELNLPKTKSRNIDSLFYQSARSFFNDYKSDNELTAEDMKDVEDNPSRYSYELTNDVSISYQTEKMLVLADNSYAYTGGAHGNSGTAYVPLNLTSNQVITLSQILTPEGIRHLRPLLENSFRRDNHLTPSQPLTDGGLFENKIEPNQNFYATGKQLIFSYTPYEIGPYAIGQIDIAVDLKELQNDLQPSFKNLIE